MNKSSLFITFHYPPVQSSSGLLRALAFSRDLTKLGWRISVLTAKLQAEDSIKEGNLRLIPEAVRVIRTLAIDAATKFSYKGRYPGILEWPDRYSSWVLSATYAGYREIKRQNISVIFSTYPIASAHLVGYLLSKMTNRMWIADFRDPMVMAEHPDTKLRRRAHRWVEEKTIQHCTAVVVTNSHAKAHYLAKYPNANPGKFHVIENGFDEGLFELAESTLENSERSLDAGRPIKILHSGTLYPNHRDPTSLFRAIKTLLPQWDAAKFNLKFIFRASGYDQYYKALVAEFDIERYVEFLEPVGYIESMNEMLTSDALLLIQGSSCNQQVPAKLYEYLRSGKPIISVTDPNGATAETLREAGVENILSCDPDYSIENDLDLIIKNLARGETGNAPISPAALQRFSREHWSGRLHDLLDELLALREIG